MPSLPGPTSGRRLLRLLVLAGVAATVAVPLLPGVAAAGPATSVVGTLVQAWPESKQESSAPVAQPLSWVQKPDGTSVRIPTDDVADVPAGATVRVTVGAPVRDAAADGDRYPAARDVLAASVLRLPADPGSSSTGDQTSGSAGQTGTAGSLQDPAGLTDQVTVAMVVPAGGTRDGATLDQLVSAVNGPVAGFWSEQSGGAIRIGVTAAHDWIDVPVGCGDPAALWTRTAAAVGFTPGPGRHLVVYLSSQPEDLPGCSYGLGEVGSGLGSGGSLYVRDTLPSLITHELGHNFGLGHSSERQCVDSVDSGACRTTPYRDYYDVMGASWEHVGSLTVAQVARLGLLPASAQQTLTTARPAVVTASLAPLSGRTGTRAVRLTDAAGEDYWLEYRTPTGQDAWLGSPTENWFGLQTGVLLHRGGDLPDTSLLLDGTPSAASAENTDLLAALPVGAPVTVAGGQFTITVQSLSASAATVRVAAVPVATPPVAAGQPAAPAPRVLPQPQSSSAGHQAAGGAAGTATSTAPAAGGAGTDPATTPSAARQSAPAGGGASPAATARLHEAAVVRSSAPGPFVLGLGGLAGCAALLAGTVAVRGRRRAVAGRGTGQGG